CTKSCEKGRPQPNSFDYADVPLPQSRWISLREDCSGPKHKNHSNYPLRFVFVWLVAIGRLPIPRIQWNRVFEDYFHPGRIASTSQSVLNLLVFRAQIQKRWS